MKLSNYVFLPDEKQIVIKSMASVKVVKQDL